MQRESVREQRIPDYEASLSDLASLSSHRAKIEAIDSALSKGREVSIEIGDDTLRIEGRHMFIHSPEPNSFEYALIERAKRMKISITTRLMSRPGNSVYALSNVEAKILAVIDIMRRGKRDRTDVLLWIYSGSPKSSESLDRARLIKCGKNLLSLFGSLPENTFVLQAIGIHEYWEGYSMHNLFEDRGWLIPTQDHQLTVPQNLPSQVAYTRFLQAFKVLESIHLRYHLESPRGKFAIEEGCLAIQTICRVWKDELFSA